MMINVNEKDETPFANDVAQLKFLAPYLFPPDEIAYQVTLAKRGLINLSAYFEETLAVLANGQYLRRPAARFDFTDYSDGKNFITNWRMNNPAKNQWTHSAQIRGIKAKIGLLRIMVYNPYNCKFYFFAIPHKFYKGKGVIDIVFETFTSSTEPKLSMDDARLDVLKWGSRFRVNSIEELATIPGDWGG